MSVGIDFDRLLVALVTGPPGPPKMRAPSPIPRPAPLNGLGGRVLLGFSVPAPGRARSPDGPPFKQVGRNGAPSIPTTVSHVS